MTNELFEISRRRLLAGLGTVGVASAGAGLGTSAYFSDREKFDGNTLVAGELDMKVAWEEHYSDWSSDELQDIPEGNVTMTDTVEFSSTQVPGIEFNTSADLEQWKANTLVESGGSLDCPDPPGITAGDDPPRKLVEISDVKPGDEGEVTFGFNLCDNPGYVWLNGQLIDENENGQTEPEADDPDEGPGVELADEIQTLLWYDEDGDNIYEPGGEGGPVDLVIVFDQSESMNGYPSDGDPPKLQNAVDGAKALVDSVGSSTNLGLTLFSVPAAPGVVRSLGSTKSGIKQDLDDLDGPDTPLGNTPDDNNFPAYSDPDGSLAPDDDNLMSETDIEGGIQAATSELTGPNARSGARQIMVLLTDGKETTGDPTDDATNAKNQGIEIFTIAYGGGADTGQLETIASSPTDEHAFVSSGPSDIQSIFGQIGQIITGEECFFRGSLRELLTVLSSQGPNDVAGIPLDGNRDTPFDEVTGTDTDGDGLPEENFAPGSGTDANRDCFPALQDHHIGFQWFLPVDHANEIQTDSVEFDLGFYTEQCRHNDGSGQSVNDGGDTPTVTLPADKNYIGYEDLPDGGDFDYNDFGMDADITETYSGGTLDKIEMEFTALEYTASLSHEIHIERTLGSNVTYDVEVSRPNHTAQGAETPAGTASGSGMLDVVLFDTSNFSSGDKVTLTVSNISGSVSPPTSSPRPDVAANNPLFEVYDPYMQYGSTRIDLGTIQDNVGAFDTDSDVPNIIVVPDPNFTPPGAGVNIQNPYPDFDDYYGDGGGDTDGDLDVNSQFDEWYK